METVRIPLETMKSVANGAQIPLETDAAMTTNPPTAGPRTSLYIHYEIEGSEGLMKFTTKPELDQWLAETGAHILTVIRGYERSFRREISLL